MRVALPFNSRFCGGARWRIASRCNALVALGIGSAALAGWSLGIEPLKRFLTSGVAMNPTTALCLLVLGGCVLSIDPSGRRGPARRAVAGLSAAVVLVCVIRLISYSLGVEAGVDQLLFSGGLDDGAQPGPNRMAPNTAISLALVGASLVALMVPGGRARAVAAVCAIAASLPCLLALVGYANGVSTLSAIGRFIAMALPTALASLCLSGGILCQMMMGEGALQDGRPQGVPASEERHRQVERTVTAGFSAAILLLMVMGLASYKTLEQFISESRDDVQVRQTLAGLGALTSDLRAVESAAAMYVITGQEAYLEPFHAASSRIAPALVHLDAMIADDSAQQRLLDSLRPAVVAQQTLEARCVEIRRDHGFEAAQMCLATGAARASADLVHERLEAVTTSVRQLSDTRASISDAGARVTVLIIAAGSVLGILIVGGAAWMVRRDTAARRKTEVDLRIASTAAEAASRAKSEFLAHMSHEIRTPLNGVIGMTELLLGAQLTPQQRRFGQIAKTSAEALTTVINDILDFSKIEAGKLEIVVAEFHLHQLVEDVMELMAQRASSKGLEMACHVHPDVPERIRGDADRLRQILINLVNNAVKFTEQGAVLLRLVVDKDDGDALVVRFSVTDTGIGIPRDRIERLFKAFSQADASTTREYGGTGLGLAISKQLAQLMGGAIGVESELGRGSTFWFTIRFEKARRAGLAMSRQRVDPREFRILTVDDSSIHREVLREQIATWGLESHGAPDAQSALSMLTEAAASGEPYRIAIIDADMPGTDGYELAQSIRSAAPLKATGLMVLLSVDTEIEPRRLRQLGFVGAINKPVRQSRLFDAIMSAARAGEADPVPEIPEDGHDGIAALKRSATERLKGTRVLVAEDHEVNQMVIQEVLSQFGCSCEIVPNGRAAVQAALGGNHDLMLMDCQMPIMDGFDATRAIREAERRRCTHLPIIALTANAMKGDREACLAAGMDAYTSKPIEPAHLLETMTTLLAARGGARAAA